MMAPCFYSLGMLVTGRIHPGSESLPLSAMDLLAQAIADEEHGYSPAIEFLFQRTRK